MTLDDVNAVRAFGLLLCWLHGHGDGRGVDDVGAGIMYELGGHAAVEYRRAHRDAERAAKASPRRYAYVLRRKGTRSRHA